MKRKIVKRLVLGFILGVTICYSISFIIFLCQKEIRVLSSMLENNLGIIFGNIVQILVTGIFGMICFGGTLFYDIESWGLFRATLCHYLGIVIGYFIASFALGWYPFTWFSVLFIFCFMTIGFFIIWAIIYFRYKKEIKELNENLEKYREEKLNEKDE